MGKKSCSYNFAHVLNEWPHDILLVSCCHIFDVIFSRNRFVLDFCKCYCFVMVFGIFICNILANFWEQLLPRQQTNWENKNKQIGNIIFRKIINSMFIVRALFKKYIYIHPRNPFGVIIFSFRQVLFNIFKEVFRFLSDVFDGGCFAKIVNGF